MNIDMTHDIDKKKIAIISGIAVLITAIVIGVIFLVAALNSPAQQSIASKAQAEKYKNQGITALQANKYSQAKDLFEKAREQYAKTGNSVGVTDMEAMIAIAEHSDD